MALSATNLRTYFSWNIYWHLPIFQCSNAFPDDAKVIRQIAKFLVAEVTGIMAHTLSALWVSSLVQGRYISVRFVSFFFPTVPHGFFVLLFCLLGRDSTCGLLQCG